MPLGRVADDRLLRGPDGQFRVCKSGSKAWKLWKRLVHGEGQVAKRVHQGVGETKCKRTCTRSGVWRPLEGWSVLNIGSHASPCRSTLPVVQHRAAAAPSSSGTLLAKSFPVSKDGSTSRGSCNDNSICGNVDEASPFGFPEFVLNCEPDGSEDVATRPLSKMMGRHGVKADKASDLVESRVSLGDRYCVIAHLFSLL